MLERWILLRVSLLGHPTFLSVDNEQLIPKTWLPYRCQTTNKGELRLRAMLTENGTQRVELAKA
jgi:hypothetical protein